jgi:hypothetical protein
MRILPATLVLVLAICAARSFAQTIDQAAESAAAEAMQAKPLTDEEFHLVLEKEFEARVDELIARLASPDFVSRQQAAKELLSIGAPTFAKLRVAYHQTDELETQLRIEEIARSAYLNYHVLDNHGFLGISMGAYDPAAVDPTRQTPEQRAQNPVLPPGRVGVFVTQVIADTGAARAGLQRNDVLIGINGQAIAGAGIEIRNNFSTIIRELRPGATVDLEVVRGADVMQVQAVLGRPPEDVARASNIIIVSSLYRIAEERFRKWWAEFFLRDPSQISQVQPPLPNEPASRESE